jgi:hypothetical protein
MSHGRLLSLPLHPLVLAVWLVLSVQVTTGVHAAATPRVWMVYLGTAALLLAAAWVVTRRREVAGLIASAAVWVLSSQDLGRVWLAVAMLLALVAAFILLQRILRRGIPLDELNRGLNVVAGLLVSLTFVQGVQNGVIPAAVADATGTLPAVGGPPEAGPAPDVYLVWLDAYPRADVLAEITGMDNDDFIGELENRGFNVAPDSRSSYMYSGLTALSLFHGRHVVDIPELSPLFDGMDQPALARQALNQAPLVEELRELGYSIIANAQAWDEPSLRRVDVYLEGTGVNEFEREVWSHRLPGLLWETVRGPVTNQDYLEPWVHDAFEAFSEAASRPIDGPRFAFIHVPSPHFPIIFRADGTRADPVFGYDHPDQIDASEQELRAAYAEQVEYVNGRILEALDQVPIPEDAIILMMSDHGPEIGLDWYDARRSDLRSRMGAFLAVRNAPMRFSDDANVSSVLLEVLRAWGRVDAPPLEDRYFVTQAINQFATMEEVADPFRSE